MGISEREDATDAYAAALDALRRGDAREALVRAETVPAEHTHGDAAVHVRAVALQRLGRLEEALALLETMVTGTGRRDGPILNTYGFMLRLAGRAGEALPLLEEALSLMPGSPEALNNLGVTLTDLGRVAEAEAAYERAIAARADFAEPHANRGALLARAGRWEEAIASFDRALALSPDYIEAVRGKVEVLAARADRAGDVATGRAARTEAVQLLSRALDASESGAGGWAEGWLRLGNLLYQLDRDGEAVRAFLRCLTLAPGTVRAHVNLAAALERMGRAERAASHLRQALLIQPNHPGALKGLGHITLKLGNPVEAIAVLEQGLRQMPADPDLLYSYGNALMRCERYQAAADAYKRVRALQPGAARGLFAPAALLLMDGQYETGWAAYESRFAMPSFKANVPDVTKALWDGRPLSGKRLLVHVEQGFGDTIQFCRYLPLLRERAGAGAEITFLCETALYPLMVEKARDAGIDRVVHLGERDVSIGYDAQLPLLSAPHRMGTRVETIPAECPYLRVPGGRAAPVERTPGRPAVAVVWAGRPNHSDDRYRSVPFDLFSRLFAVEGADFHSVQLGARAADLARLPGARAVTDHAGDIGDFADTAAILDACDLTIAVDTAVAHLAGALGRPVWTLIPHGGEWRWLRGQETTPWYPTMRLFRQRVIGDWTGVIARVGEALGRFTP
ncbi:tetratricopeptide repeat protein [Marivibrio halodurans]|uniref:Tetratricopeptide repeat protein n=1 Tax=Marivibrio halodurans TaxID=2039722 RepID=A0A8J7S6X8_9PROT|nr:tetratricopeptide repeat protein [Marivibrio halodurans]MBP5856702.1 tetratricopeptide repeat protein [Marivibrio halodurans]